MEIKTKYGKIILKKPIISKIPNYPKKPLNIKIKDLLDSKVDQKSSFIHMAINGQEISLEKAEENISLSKINFFYSKSSPHKVKLPNVITPKLAYLIGYIYGDGGLKDIWRSYHKSGKFDHKVIIGDEFKIQIIQISKLIEEIFNVKTKIRTERKEKGQNMYYINPTCKVLYRYLTKIFELPSGSKSDKIRIPNIINKSNKQIKLWFLKGFIDADGDTRAMEMERTKSPSPRIKIRLCAKDMIKDLQKMLNEEFFLNFTGPYSDNPRNHYIQTAKEGSRKAQKLELFNHPVKKWRLNKMAESFKK